MPKTAQPAPITGEIVFELERFELGGDRLELSGRWFGVRGRRFVRPTLTPLGGHDRSRMLADLEHKPWAAEDGERWEAAFPWIGNGGVAKFELSVAPDLSIELPAPGARSGRSRRLTAIPRRPLIEPAWRRPEPEQVEEAGSTAPAEIEPVEVSLERVRRELQATRAELEAARGELTDRDAQLERVRGESDAAQGARAAAASEVADTVAALDRTASERDQWRGEHDRILGELDELVAQRDQLTAELARVQGERNQLAADFAQAQAQMTELGSALQHATAQLDEAGRRRDAAITAHGAALVMRRAARAEPHYAKPSEWWRPIAAILGLFAVIFAILIVVHVL